MCCVYNAVYQVDLLVCMYVCVCLFKMTAASFPPILPIHSLSLPPFLLPSLLSNQSSSDLSSTQYRLCPHVCSYWKSEQEVSSLQNKVRLLEEDLDQAEDRASDSSSKLKEAETHVDDLDRSNKQLQRQIDSLESKYVASASRVCLSAREKKTNGEGVRLCKYVCVQIYRHKSQLLKSGVCICIYVHVHGYSFMLHACVSSCLCPCIRCVDYVVFPVCVRVYIVSMWYVDSLVWRALFGMWRALIGMRCDLIGCTCDGCDQMSKERK